MPQIQILPSVPTFGSRLAQTLGHAVSNVAEGFAEKKQRTIVQGLLEQLKNPNASSMDKLTVATQIATRYPEAAKALLPLYAPFIYEENKPAPQPGTMDEQHPEATSEPITAATQPQGVQNAPSPSGQTESDLEAKRKAAKARLGLPYGIGERAKEEIADIRHKEKLEFQKQKFGEEKVDKSFAAHKDFIDETRKSYQAFEDTFKPRLLQMQALSDQELIGPTASKILDTLGIPLGSLENPSSEVYTKLSQDLLKGLPESFGNRILKVEVENFLKTIPTLLNSPDGRRLITSNFLKLGEMKEVYFNEMRKQEKEAIDSNKPLPRDFENRVYENTKPQIDRINREFVKLAELQNIPPNTVPFFNPQGEISFVPKTPEAMEWAEQNGGRRIW